MSTFAEYHQFDGLGLAELVRKGEVTPLELVEEAIRRIELFNPQVNAVVYTMFNQARSAVRDTMHGDLPDGPFRGVPFLVKDLLSMVAGAPTSSGTRLLKDWAPPIDSEMVARWKAAGLVIVGKTNTPEFGVTPYTEPELFGPTRNPYDLTRTAGGSSGGSAAAVAAGMVPAAGGGDGGGSIRIPAACCGLFGLKPTRGRTPSGPIQYEDWEGFAIEHALTRSVRDSAALLDATAGLDVGAPYAAPAAARPYREEVERDPGPLRIAFSAKALFGAPVQPGADILAGLDKTARLLEDLGHHVEEAAPAVDAEELAVAFVTMLTGQVANDIAETAALVGRKAKRSDFELANWVLGMVGRAISGADYVRSLRTLQRTARRVGPFFTQYDVLLTPTLSQLPAPMGSLQPTPAEQRQLSAIAALHAGKLVTALNMVKPVALKTFAFMPYTPLFNVTGQPAMSVPLHWTAEGLPVGMHFVGRFGDEATLFRLAGQLEKACPWSGHRPRLTA